MKSLDKVLSNLYKIFTLLAGKGFFKSMQDEKYLIKMYRGMVSKKLKINHPQTFNEKIQWLKLHDRKPIYTQMTDKYLVRNFIREKLGEEYLIPLLGVWENFDDINFDLLPNQFVLKCTHDSGGIIICKNKDNFNLEEARKKINCWLERNYYYFGREWPYKNIKSRIVCEKYLVDETGEDLKDYKIFCFDGAPKLIQVDFNRFADHRRNIYTTTWDFVDMTIQYNNQPSFIIKRPDRLDDMLHFAKILSKGIPHVRVDFYSIRNQVYFGELTFYHGSGFEKFTPESYDTLLGSWLILPDRSGDKSGAK